MPQNSRQMHIIKIALDVVHVVKKETKENGKQNDMVVTLYDYAESINPQKCIITKQYFINYWKPWIEAI